MSIWNVLVSLLRVVYLTLMYSFGFEIGYEAVMEDRLLVGMD